MLKLINFNGGINKNCVFHCLICESPTKTVHRYVALSHMFCFYSTNVRLYLKAYNEGKDVLWVHLQNYKKQLLASSCLSVCMEQFTSTWTDFLKIRYLIIFQASVENIQVSFKFDKNNMYFTRRPVYIWDKILLISSQNQKCLIQNYRENQNTYITFNKILPEMLPFMRLSGKIWHSQTFHRLQTICVCNMKKRRFDWNGRWLR
jgi:hypothetical protein